MAVVTRVGGVQRRRRTHRARDLRGYSAGRRAYDARRRREPLDSLGRQMKAIVQLDPCALCGAPPTVDADHVDPLERGGENKWWNLGGVCHSCNASKGNDPLLIAMLRGRDTD